MKRQENITMDDKSIRRNLYRVLRKAGVRKTDIQLDASFSEDLQFDTTDWKIFTFYLEDIFQITVQDNELEKCTRLDDTLRYLGHFTNN
ncbi:MAG: acyl carrier protein [Prolixibacteraceae bacterium]|nr:acyl carrier protein [Prolixibacteraceae bacterium]